VLVTPPGTMMSFAWRRESVTQTVNQSGGANAENLEQYVTFVGRFWIRDLAIRIKWSVHDGFYLAKSTWKGNEDGPNVPEVSVTLPAVPKQPTDSARDPEILQ
jgi:hypothetical protein